MGEQPGADGEVRADGLSPVPDGDASAVCRPAEQGGGSREMDDGSIADQRFIPRGSAVHHMERARCTDRTMERRDAVEWEVLHKRNRDSRACSVGGLAVKGRRRASP